MIDEFKAWLEDNTGLYASLDAALDRLTPGSRILAVGPFSLIAAAIAGERVDEAAIELMCADEEALADFRRNIALESRIPVRQGVEGVYDLVYAPMYVNHIPKKDLVAFLFDVYDCLSYNGHFIFSFEDSLRVDLSGERPVPLWFCDQEVMTKYYTVEDVLNTLVTIGFKVRGIEEVEGEGIVHAVSFDCTR